MTSHHDVAGVVADLHVYAKDWRTRAGSKEIVDRAIEALESQAKALSEAEAAYDGLMKAKETFRAEAHRNAARALAAEARLAEAISILEFYAEPFEYIKKHGLEEHAPDFYDELNTGERAQDFLNAAKEKTDADD